jgi:hypothetical protein
MQSFSGGGMSMKKDLTNEVGGQKEEVGME